MRQLADGSGTVAAVQHYDPFGAPTDNYGSASSVFGFTGEPHDATGLIHLRARYYSPGTGRFVSVDPFEGRQRQPYTFHPYQYGYGNPIKFIDRTGLDPLVWPTCDEDGTNCKPWNEKFEEVHGYEPDPLDKMVYLLSLLYNEEWTDERRKQLYGESMRGELNEDALLRWLQHAPADRSWDTLPEKMAELGNTYYAKPGEKEFFVQDMALLLAGMESRAQTEARIWKEHAFGRRHATQYWAIGAIQGDNMHLYLQPGSIDPSLAGNDGDANVHHWIWAFTMGYDSLCGPTAGTAINTTREFFAGFEFDLPEPLDWVPTGYQYDHTDRAIGGAGVQMGYAFAQEDTGYNRLPELFEKWLKFK